MPARRRSRASGPSRPTSLRPKANAKPLRRSRSVPAAATSDGLSEIESRREALRQRIRDLGARRTGRALPAPDLAPGAEDVSSQDRLQRMSLRLAAARSRRGSRRSPPCRTEPTTTETPTL